MASYTPLLQHYDLTQWLPDLVGYDSTPDSLTGSASYYVQKMFSVNRRDIILPVEADGDFGPVYWAASSTEGAYYVKLANYGSDTQSVTVKSDGTATSASLRLWAGTRHRVICRAAGDYAKYEQC